MKDRIAHIMRAKNLKATDFAALLGIQPSGVSHILAGRNNPSLEFVKKIKETFPEYNLDWIIFGKGPMTTSEPYRAAFEKEPQNSPVAQESYRQNQEPATLFDAIPVTEVAASETAPGIAPGTAPERLPENVPVTPLLPTSSEPSSSIRYIMVFYEDGTFEQFSPR